MAHSHEALESVAERARRALRDNEEANLQAQRLQTLVRPDPEPAPLTPLEPPAERPSAGVMAEMITERIQAIARLKDLEPRLASARLRAQELSQRLTSTATDSVHYADLLRRLSAVHTELRQLEGEHEEAQHVIRSSAWLMKMLADPT